jgi:predicted transcriptional regulator
MALFSAGESHAELADKLGATVSQIKSYLHQARGKLKRTVAELIKEYSGSSAEYRQELRYLLKFLRR